MSKSLFVKFKQASHIAGKDYAKESVHEVSEALAGHHYFQKLVNAGLVVETQPAQLITPKSLAERQAELAEKLKAKSPLKLEAEKAKQKADSEAPKSEGEEQSLAEKELEAEEQAEGESDEVEHKEHPAHKNKKSKR